MKNNLFLYVFVFFIPGFFWGQSAPSANTDAYTTDINTSLNINATAGLLQNDTDADGDALTVISFTVDGTVYNAGENAVTEGGNLIINSDGSLLYTPNDGYSGNESEIVYTVSDGSLSSQGDVSISVIIRANAKDDYDTADINTTLSVSAPGVLGNDTFENIDSIAIVSFRIRGTVYNVGDTATIPEGNFRFLADGSFEFEPSLDYTGSVPSIVYTISDGSDTSSASLFLTVQNVDNLVELENFSSCNQGYSFDGSYKIQYSFTFRNTSTAQDYHPTSLIKNIDLRHDLDDIYGSGCVIAIDDVIVNTSIVTDYVSDPYPLDFDNASVNPDFLTGSSDNLFSPESITNAILYPRQEVSVSFCVTINPFCGGRPNPTPSGSGINFNSTLDLFSSTDPSSASILLQDFHTTEAVIKADLSIPDNSPLVNPDGTYDFINSVIITNEGTSVANNVNFNMGLGNFLDNGLSFRTLSVSQASGPAVSVNQNYDGDTNTQLLESNNSLSPGETIVIDIFHLINPGNSNNNEYNQIRLSQTQGALDGFDEDTPSVRRLSSYATWEDGLGQHLDRYYTDLSSDPDPNYQCNCEASSMVISFSSSARSKKEITSVNEAPSGILEHEELTFQLTFRNTSQVVDLINLQLVDDLSRICAKNPIALTPPQIVSSTATTDPVLNASYDGVSDLRIFDGNSGLLRKDESITVEFTAVFVEDCIGSNSMLFSGENPTGNLTTSTATAPVNAFTDSDNDGISNVNDLDDDNDTILDIDEYDGIDPLGDDDGDFIPNYRDTDFGPDANNDGIVDRFDFDGDGIPNHFDLDSDNDGLFDITEVDNPQNGNGQTENPVGLNGLDDTVETDDTSNASVTYLILNSDSDPLPDFRDIDSDGDGIVDNIEAQPTDNYIPPNNVIDDNGVDTAYINGLNLVDTDGDDIPDYLDLNSDNDIRDDAIEGWDFDSDGIAETVASGIDVDGDGLDDAFDRDNTQVNPTNGQIPTDFPNADYDVTPERDWREIMAIVVLVDDISEEEGNDLIFNISLVRYIDNTSPIQSATPIDITFFTTDGTESTGLYDEAISPFDYEGVSNASVVIPAFTETFELRISSFDDTIFEMDELLTLSGSITTTNTINTELEAIGTILDNDPEPSISMNDDTVFEGEDLEFFITLSNPSSTPIDVEIVSSDFTAISPEDYESNNTTFTIEGTTNPANPNLNDSFRITTLLDNLNEPDEELLDVLGIVTSGNVSAEDLTKRGTILDVDPNPFIVISEDRVEEGETLVFTLSLLNAEGELMRNYLPIDFELQTIDITTTANRDYPRLFDFQSIPALESTLTIEIPTINDKLNENTETLNLSASVLSSPIANPTSVILGLGTIIDNDIANLFSPNNDGRSDVFRIGLLEEYPNFKMIIFDRWGGEIYRYSNNGKSNPDWWDGTHNGKPVVEGVYYYVLDFNDGIKEPKTGFIQLIR